MKKFEKKCSSCGSIRFQQAEQNMWVCEYCHTKYMSLDNGHTKHTGQGDRHTIPPERRAGSRQKYIIIGVIAAFVIMIGFPLFLIILATIPNNSGTTSDNTTAGDWYTDEWDFDEWYERGLENITLVPNWTEDIYNEIEVAASHRNVDLRETTFSNGGYLSDLMEIVGKPNEIRNGFSVLDAVTYDATWRSPDDWGAHNVYIAISFEPETGMIVSKEIMAYAAFEENSERIGFALDNIETLSNWTEEIFHDIMPARQRRDFENNERTVADGDYFYDLAEIVGQPNTIRSSTWDEQTIVTATWTRRTDDYTVSVFIEYEEDSGMIIRKSLYSF